MEVQVAAFGKINLLLEVLGQRPDGYHAVNMIMQGVRLSDRIHVAEARCQSYFYKQPLCAEQCFKLGLEGGLVDAGQAGSAAGDY